MEYSFSQLSNIAKSLRERYPIGTRIMLLHMGEDPRPIPPGTKGTVEGIDDIATVFCKFDNGRSLGLAYGEDQYRALTQRELLEEKCARNYDKYYDAVHRDIFADVDLDRFAEEIENADDSVHKTGNSQENLGICHQGRIAESVLRSNKICKSRLGN